MSKKNKVELKVITYNVDGLPVQLDLNTLPWILKPITWIYKLIKKTNIIKINDDAEDSIIKSKQIGKCLLSTDADIIGVQEDFNYHNEIMSEMKHSYNDSTYMGGIDLSKILSNTEIFSHFPLPRYKIDGLNLITKNNRIKVLNEHIEKWNKCYGYVSNANDLLVHKGFRYYDILVDDTYRIDVYVLHMDADYQHLSPKNVEKDIEARRDQLHQLINHIKANYNFEHTNPIIIMGDTNCSLKRDFDIETIQNHLIDPINACEQLTIEEAINVEKRDLDRIFYINHKNSDYKLKVKDCKYDLSFNEVNGRISDHYPFIVNFEIS